MNVLRVIDTMNPAAGGPSQGIRNLAPELLKLNVNNEVVCMDNVEETFLYEQPFKIHALGKSKGPWKYNSMLILWLHENIHRFDVVIIHGLWFYYGFATYKVWRKNKQENPSNTTKLFVMPHGMLDPWFQIAKGRRMKSIRNWLYWKIIENKIVNYSDGLLFTCEEEMKLASTTFLPYKPKSEINIGYGIKNPPQYVLSMRQAFTSKVPIIKNDPYFLFISRINVKKGIGLLINAYLSLKDEGFILPQLVIAGPGLDSEYGEKMMKLANIDSNIIFPGMLTGDEKWGAFYGCSVFILPSHQENFGIAIVEAMACAKSVITTNKVNIWREIESSGAGIIADDTESSLKESIKKWLNLSDSEREIMNTKSLNTFKSDFSLNKRADTFLDLLSE